MKKHYFFAFLTFLATSLVVFVAHECYGHVDDFPTQLPPVSSLGNAGVVALVAAIINTIVVSVFNLLNEKERTRRQRIQSDSNRPNSSPPSEETEDRPSEPI